MGIDRDSGLLWFCFTSLCDWSKKLAPQSQPIKWKTKTNLSLVTRVFPLVKQVAPFTLSSYWLIMVIELSGVQFGLKSYA